MAEKATLSFTPPPAAAQARIESCLEQATLEPLLDRFGLVAEADPRSSSTSDALCASVEISGRMRGLLCVRADLPPLFDIAVRENLGSESLCEAAAMLAALAADSLVARLDSLGLECGRGCAESPFSAQRLYFTARNARFSHVRRFRCGMGSVEAFLFFFRRR